MNKTKQSTQPQDDLSALSPCFRDNKFAIFAGLLPDMPNLLVFIFLKKDLSQGYIPICNSQGCDVKNGYDCTATIDIIEKESTCFLWTLLEQKIAPACLDNLLRNSQSLREKINSRIDPFEFSNYRFKTQIRLNNTATNTKIEIEKIAPDIHRDWRTYYSWPLAFNAVSSSNRALLDTLMRHGADPHQNAFYSETQLKSMIPDFFGSSVSKKDHTFRILYAQYSTQLEANGILANKPSSTQNYTGSEQGFMSTLHLPFLRITLNNDAEFSISLLPENGQPSTTLCHLLRHQTVDIRFLNQDSEETTIANLLDRGYSGNTQHTAIRVTYDSKLITITPLGYKICTKKMTQGAPDQSGEYFQFSLHIPFSPGCKNTPISLTTPMFSATSRHDVALFLIYGPHALENGLNLIQYSAHMKEVAAQEILLNYGADLFQKSDQINLNQGLKSILAHYKDPSKHPLFDRYLLSSSLRANATQLITQLLKLRAYSFARILLLSVRSDLNINTLCEDYLDELYKIVSTPAQAEINFTRMQKSGESGTKHSAQTYFFNRTEESVSVSATVFGEFLHQHPELITAIFEHSNKSELFQKTITALIEQAISKNMPQLIVFLLDNHTDVALNFISGKHNLHNHLFSIAQSCPAVTRLLDQLNPAFLLTNEQPKHNPLPSYADPAKVKDLTDKLIAQELALAGLLDQANNAGDAIDALDKVLGVTLTKQQEKGVRLLTRLKKDIATLNDNLQEPDLTRRQYQHSKDSETLSLLQNDITSLIRLARAAQTAQQTNSNPKPTDQSPPEPGTKTAVTTKQLTQPRCTTVGISKPISSANKKNPPGQYPAELDTSSAQETTYYNRCIQMFFSTEWPDLHGLALFTHFLPIRFCIFLLDIHSNTQDTQRLQPICPLATLTTVRNIYAHYAFFFCSNTHNELSKKLEQIKVYFDERTLKFSEVQKVISSWVGKAYDLGIAGLGADVDKQVPPTELTRAKLYELYAKAPPEKRAARIQMLLSTIEKEITVAKTPGEQAQPSITMRLCALELGEHLKADRTGHAPETETASTDETSKAKTVHPNDTHKVDSYKPLLPDCNGTFTELFTWLIRSRHYFFHHFFTRRDQTVATLKQQALSTHDNLTPIISAPSAAAYTTLNTFFLAPSHIKELVLLHEKHRSVSETYRDESHRYNSSEAGQETESAGKPSLSL